VQTSGNNGNNNEKNILANCSFSKMDLVGKYIFVLITGSFLINILDKSEFLKKNLKIFKHF